MTVTLSKRLFEDSSIGSGCLSSPQASKKLRGLTPLADHLLTSCHSRPAAAGLGSLQQLHHSSARKRRHDTGTDSTNGAASPSTGIKRVSLGSLNLPRQQQAVYARLLTAAACTALVNPHTRLSTRQAASQWLILGMNELTATA